MAHDTSASPHIVSPKVYLGIFATLLVLTGVTVMMAEVDLGRLNAVVALSVAVCKATLVLLYFMHLRYSSRLTWLVVVAGFVFLGILIGLTIADSLTRNLLIHRGV